jgi:hypothetical protein
MSAPLSEQQLAEIRARAEAATEGPWARADFGHAGEQEPSSTVVHTGTFDWNDLNSPDGTSAVAWMAAWDSQADDNAAFIAAARSDVPALLAEVNRLRAERDAYADRVDTLTSVAKGNKRHVQEMYGDLIATQARGAELEQLLTARRELFLAEYETDEPRLYLTLDAARDALTTARTAGDPLMPWAWQEQDGVWSQWRTDPDEDDRPVELLLGSIMRVALPAGLLAGEPPREAAQPADDGGRCGRCRRPFDPGDTRWDGHAEYRDSGYCRSCVDLCHNTELADHRCPICAGPGERS